MAKLATAMAPPIDGDATYVVRRLILPCASRLLRGFLMKRMSINCAASVQQWSRNVRDARVLGVHVTVATSRGGRTARITPSAFAGGFSRQRVRSIRCGQ